MQPIIFLINCNLPNVSIRSLILFKGLQNKFTVIIIYYYNEQLNTYWLPVLI